MRNIGERSWPTNIFFNKIIVTKKVQFLLLVVWFHPFCRHFSLHFSLLHTLRTFISRLHSGKWFNNKFLKFSITISWSQWWKLLNKKVVKPTFDVFCCLRWLGWVFYFVVVFHLQDSLCADYGVYQCWIELMAVDSKIVS